MNENTASYIDYDGIVYDGFASTCEKTINLFEDTEIVFADGTVVSAEKLSFLIKTLERIIAKDYPEELL